MGGFFGEDFVRGGICPVGEVCPGQLFRGDVREKGSLYVNFKLLKYYYMLHLDVGGGGIYLVGFSGEGLFIRYFGVY